MKLLLASAFLLAGFVGLSNPAKAYCSYDLESYAFSQCLDNESRLSEIESRQRDIQRELDSQSRGY